MARIAIIGLGLIGASVGLALKKNARVDIEIVGCDRDGSHANRAKKLGAVDRTEWSAAAAAEGADLVLVAAPIIAVRSVFAEIAPALRPGAIVTDTASVKGAIQEAAAELLPANVHFVGGHPMAGSDRSGPDAASASLFVDADGKGRPYCIVPSPGASEDAVRTVLGLVEMLGAEPVFIDAKEHDALVAGVSHMPILLSTALFMMARNSPGWNDMAPLAGPAFHDLTRLAKGSPEMALDIFFANRENVLHWIERLEAELARFRAILAGEERPLHEELLRAQIEREVFENRDAPRGEPMMPRASDQFMTLLVGDRVMQRTRDIMELGQTDPKERRLRERERQQEQARGDR